MFRADKDFSLSKDEEKLKRNQSFKETFILQQVEAPEVNVFLVLPIAKSFFF